MSRVDRRILQSCAGLAPSARAAGTLLGRVNIKHPEEHPAEATDVATIEREAQLEELGGAWRRCGRYRQANSPRSLALMRLVVDTESVLGLRQRRRLERDLHDGARQRLVSLALTLRKAREKLDSEPGEAARLLDRSRAQLDEALTELRELARGIHPAVLRDRGLGAAIETLAHPAPLPVEVRELPGKRLPEHVELAAYFVVSEALTNVAKYASASRASVTVTKENGRLG
jgi:signal transduction histidine kinase